MNRKTRLFTSLMCTYILFGLTIGIIEGILGFFIDDWFILGKSPKLTASELVREDYENIPVDKIETLGGRIEILDKQLRVMYAKGRPGWPEKYTEKQLLQLLEDKKDRKYIYTLAFYNSKFGEKHALLVTMPKEGNYVCLHFNLAFFLLFSLSVYFYSRWTSKRITGPLEKIVQAIQRMKDGHYNERLSYKSNYELTKIQEHFNEMGARLEQTDREKKELELSKQQMLLDLSHDLRTPITTIQGYTRALQLGIVEEPEQKQRYLQMISNKSNVLNNLIEDMLQLTALESPEYPIILEDSNLAELLRHIAIEYDELFTLKGFTMNVQIPEEQVKVRMDNKLMRRAVSNLLSNTLKHNKPGTEVSLILEDTEKYVKVSVCDNGDGIPGVLKQTLFQPFVRGDQSRKSDGGTGLGLSISRKIAELHGGELRLGDNPEATVFEIILPKS
jgi:signal transduction histidine kinase